MVQRCYEKPFQCHKYSQITSRRRRDEPVGRLQLYSTSSLYGVHIPCGNGSVSVHCSGRHELKYHSVSSTCLHAAIEARV